MIASIEIQNYRNLKNINIDLTGQLNLITGKNNTGKTNFLESIFFYASQKEIHLGERIVINDQAIDLLPDDEILSPQNVKFIRAHSSIQSLLHENSFDCFTNLITEKAVKFLKRIDDRISEVDFLADNLRNPIATFKDGKTVALLRMGSGVHRILTILLALSTSKNGIVLIDEIENGFHYGVEEELWALISAIAKDQNIQVFAATHSIDTIRAFGEIINDEKEAKVPGLLIKFENIEGIIEPLTFDPEELKVIVDNSIEVRK